MAQTKHAGKAALAAAALGAAAAGYYFYSSSDAKKHRHVAAKWAQDLKRDVLKAARNAKNIDKKTLETIVSNAAKTYQGLKNLDRVEVERAARELKSNWQQVMKELGKTASATKKKVARLKKAAPKAKKRTSSKK